MVTRVTTVYIDAGLLTDPELDGVALATEIGLLAVVVQGASDLPDDLSDAWHLTEERPSVGSTRWARTVMIGPRPEPGRVAHTGLRSARDLRVALLELASEATTD